MPAPVELKGQTASAGLALGLVFFLPEPVAQDRVAGSPSTEAAALRGAIAASVASITGLIEGHKGEAADILEFQVAMLEDDTLLQPALDRVNSGSPAQTAWREVLDTEIAGYAASPEDYFRARASDLMDMRDRVLMNLAGAAAKPKIPGGAIILATDVPPSRFLELDWSQGGGLVLAHGSTASHVAMLARARGVPMLVGVAGADVPGGHSEAILEASSGRLCLSPSAADKEIYEASRQAAQASHRNDQAYATKPAVTRDGIAVEILVNVAEPSDLDRIAVNTCDGIGLMRSEFLFRDGAPLPDEDQQFTAYCRLLEWAQGRPVTVRTLDIGGDKPVQGLTAPGESNPFLGLRGVRLTLVRRDVFKAQLRALARAAVHGQLKIMLPMVSVPEEIAESARLLDDVMADLAAAGVPARRPALGIMVEVPAVAIVPELFAPAAFFSIGSNDLTQYVMAAARDLAAIGRLYQPGNPAMLALIRNTVRAAGAMGRPVSLCGDMAGDERYIGALLAAGLRSLSVAPAALGHVKAVIAGLTIGAEHTNQGGETL